MTAKGAGENEKFLDKIIRESPKDKQTHYVRHFMCFKLGGF